MDLVCHKSVGVKRKLTTSVKHFKHITLNILTQFTNRSYSHSPLE